MCCLRTKLEEREVGRANGPADGLRLHPPGFRRNEFRAAPAPFGAGVGAVVLRDHPGEALPRRDDLHAAVLELDVRHRSMASLQPAVDEELRLRLRIGVDELVEVVIGGDDSPPDVKQKFGTDDRALFPQNTFLLLFGCLR